MKAPRIRYNCIDGIRPCPWISCTWHMIWMTNNRKYGKRFNFEIFQKSDDEVVDFIFNMKETCVLDVCDHEGETLEYIGECMGVTRERVRQIEGSKRAGGLKKQPIGLRRLRHPMRARLLKEYYED